MRFTITFKTPDAVDDVVADYASHGCGSSQCGERWRAFSGDCLDCARAEKESQEQQEEIRDFANKFIEYGECVTIEFDTVKNTATVLRE